MKHKKLLVEEVTSNIDTLNEDVNGKKSLYMVGPFLQAEDRNRNGRIYGRSLIEREVNKYKSLVESNEAIGEFQHPDHGEINLNNAAIMIKSLVMDGNLAIGKALVMEELTAGNLLGKLLRYGVRLGVSSRGTGDVDENNYVCENYNLITIDAVYMPSAPLAYTDAIYESVEQHSNWVLNKKTGLLVEKKNIYSYEQIKDLKDDIIKQESSIKQFKSSLDNFGSKTISMAFKNYINNL